MVSVWYVAPADIVLVYTRAPYLLPTAIRLVSLVPNSHPVFIACSMIEQQEAGGGAKERLAAMYLIPVPCEG